MKPGLQYPMLSSWLEQQEWRRFYC